ncbi:site-specific DNA-methyltransferase [Patescibacteria group bacterium]|uniref:Putative methyltransferase n=1 Tax=viral metagenome TaxID=1070528 RepID=A0A6M3M9Z0_9ZZZZ|nr:site-specific DNA-methyltransferase [Patescibacteria group bacterium]
MNVYYQDRETVIYHQDCISGMNELAEGLYDLVCTSPPYGIGKKYEENESFGDWLKLMSDFYTASYRIVKKGGYAIIVFADYYMFGGSKTRVQPMAYLHHLIAERAGWVHQCTRIWQKDFATLVDPYTISGNLPKLEYEFVATLRKPGGGREKVREQQYHPRAIWNTSGKRQATSTLKLHPAAFPEHLVKMILDVYSDPGDTVVDPFGGSGTVPFIAKKMGRRSIMFDTGEEYCETSRIRCCQQVFDMDNINKGKQSKLLEGTDETINGEMVEAPPDSF